MIRRYVGDAAARKVARRWGDHTSASNDFSPEVYWLAVPEVQRRHQARLTGAPNGTWTEFVLKEYCAPLPSERVLSLGCGDGSLEREMAALGGFRECDAFDLSPAAIEQARRRAAEAGAGGIRYAVVDLNRFEFPPARYDSVWFNGSLHHISALESVLDGVMRALKPGGLLILHEYTGPNHFDFTRRQKEAIQAAFALIPVRYRRSFNARDRGSLVTCAPIPNPGKVRKADPSEAVRSADILREVDRRFRIVLHRKAGGTLLQFLLSGIAGNFRSGDAASMRILRMLFEIEDALIDSGELDSDFVLVVARRD